MRTPVNASPTLTAETTPGPLSPYKCSASPVAAASTSAKAIRSWKSPMNGRSTPRKAAMIMARATTQSPVLIASFTRCQRLLRVKQLFGAGDRVHIREGGLHICSAEDIGIELLQAGNTVALCEVEKELLILLITLAQTGAGIRRKVGRRPLVKPGRVGRAIGVGGHTQGGVGADVDQFVTKGVHEICVGLPLPATNGVVHVDRGISGRRTAQFADILLAHVRQRKNHIPAVIGHTADLGHFVAGCPVEVGEGINTVHQPAVDQTRSFRVSEPGQPFFENSLLARDLGDKPLDGLALRCVICKRAGVGDQDVLNHLPGGGRRRMTPVQISLSQREIDKEPLGRRHFAARLRDDFPSGRDRLRLGIEDRVLPNSVGRCDATRNTCCDHCGDEMLELHGVGSGSPVWTGVGPVTQ